MKRRDFALGLPASAALASLPAQAQSGRAQSITLGMTLEPPGLDPTAGAASAIAEVVLYNVFETLTKIQPDGSVVPLLAERWETSADLKTLTFHLRRDVRFSNGEALTAHTVQFSFERAAAEGSTNKDKRTFAAMRSVRALDAHTVQITTAEPDPDLPFLLGQATAIIVEPKSAATNATQPVGTGPYVLERWTRGASLTLKASPSWRAPDARRIQQAHFRFISDPAAQVAAVLSGDVDVFARVSPRGRTQFERRKNLQTLVCGSRAKTVLALNNTRQILRDVRVRRAISAAIDRKAVITAAGDGLGVPIGSHYVPSAPGYVDTTGVNPYNPDKARALLKEAGITTALELSLVLPPPPYARQGGEVIVSQLAQAGIRAKVRNVEWAQWLANTYGGAHDYDMTIISHVEPFDLGNFARPGYYWGYQNPQFNTLYERLKTTAQPAERQQLLAQAQQLLAQDAALVWLYQPQWLTVASANVRGLWADMPIFTNDLLAMSRT